MLDGTLAAKTSKTPLLGLSNNQNNPIGNLINASSIQADGVLTLNSANHHFNSGGDVSIVSKAVKLFLLNTHNATSTNQTPCTLNAHQGNLALQAGEVYLQGAT